MSSRDDLAVGAQPRHGGAAFGRQDCGRQIGDAHLVMNCSAISCFDMPFILSSLGAQAPNQVIQVERRG
jgi:hypothetical protein